MLRRNLTKIELKLEDLQELEHKIKSETEAKKSNDKLEGSPTIGLESQQKTRQEIIEERIGYNPRPRRPT